MTKRNSKSYTTVAEKVLFQPWFLPRRVAYAVHAIVPRDFWRKMRYFFEDYGCMICGKESEYHSNGMCATCADRTRRKLAQSVKRRVKDASKLPLDLELFRQQKLARKLLEEFRLPSERIEQGCFVTGSLANPVYEALCTRRDNLPTSRCAKREA